MQERYNSLIVDPDSAARMRLKQATTSCVYFDKVHQIATLGEAQSRLSNGYERCDVVFLSCRLSKSEISTFIKEAKATQMGQDAAYILVLQGNAQDTATVAENVMVGADSFLFEPYSVDSLLEITQLASKLKKERHLARQERALRLVVADLMNRLDIMAYLKATGHEVPRHMREFKEKCDSIRALDPESIDIYQQIILDMFEKAPLPKPLPTTMKYAGASNRLKKKMEQKIVAQMQKQGENS